MNSYVKDQVVYLISRIKNQIQIKNLDLIELCQKLYLNENDLVDIMIKPRPNISLYLDILDVIESEMR